MAKREKPYNEANVEKTHIVGLGFISQGADGNATVADVKDGKVVRIRPLHFDAQDDPEVFNPGKAWKIEARGKTFEPPMKTMV